MPYLSRQSSYAALTTAEKPDEDPFGTLVARDLGFDPAPWIQTVAENPQVIWYWMREAKGQSLSLCSRSQSIFHRIYHSGHC